MPGKRDSTSTVRFPPYDADDLATRYLEASCCGLPQCDLRWLSVPRVLPAHERRAHRETSGVVQAWKAAILRRHKDSNNILFDGQCASQITTLRSCCFWTERDGIA